MKKKTVINIIVACLIVVVAGLVIRGSGLGNLGIKSKHCEGNGTCGMKYFKAIRDEKFSKGE